MKSRVLPSGVRMVATSRPSPRASNSACATSSDSGCCFPMPAQASTTQPGPERDKPAQRDAVQCSECKETKKTDI